MKQYNSRKTPIKTCTSVVTSPRNDFLSGVETDFPSFTDIRSVTRHPFPSVDLSPSIQPSEDSLSPASSYLPRGWSLGAASGLAPQYVYYLKPPGEYHLEVLAIQDSKNPTSPSSLSSCYAAPDQRDSLLPSVAIPRSLVSSSLSHCPPTSSKFISPRAMSQATTVASRGDGTSSPIVYGGASDRDSEAEYTGPLCIYKRVGTLQIRAAGDKKGGVNYLRHCVLGRSVEALRVTSVGTLRPEVRRWFSREHCCVSWMALRNGRAAFYLVDLKSANGTFLNGKRIAPRMPAALKNGDCIGVSMDEDGIMALGFRFYASFIASHTNWRKPEQLVGLCFPGPASPLVPPPIVFSTPARKPESVQNGTAVCRIAVPFVESARDSSESSSLTACTVVTDMDAVTSKEASALCGEDKRDGTTASSLPSVGGSFDVQFHKVRLSQPKRAWNSKGEDLDTLSESVHSERGEKPCPAAPSASIASASSTCLSVSSLLPGRVSGDNSQLPPGFGVASSNSPFVRTIAAPASCLSVSSTKSPPHMSPSASSSGAGQSSTASNTSVGFMCSPDSLLYARRVSKTGTSLVAMQELLCKGRELYRKEGWRKLFACWAKAASTPPLNVFGSAQTGSSSGTPGDGSNIPISYAGRSLNPLGVTAEKSRKTISTTVVGANATSTMHSRKVEEATLPLGEQEPPSGRRFSFFQLNKRRLENTSKDSRLVLSTCGKKMQISDRILSPHSRLSSTLHDSICAPLSSPLSTPFELPSTVAILPGSEGSSSCRGEEESPLGNDCCLASFPPVFHSAPTTAASPPLHSYTLLHEGDSAQIPELHLETTGELHGRQEDGLSSHSGQRSNCITPTLMSPESSGRTGTRSHGGPLSLGRKLSSAVSNMFSHGQLSPNHLNTTPASLGSRSSSSSNPFFKSSGVSPVKSFSLDVSQNVFGGSGTPSDLCSPSTCTSGPDIAGISGDNVFTPCRVLSAPEPLSYRRSINFIHEDVLFEDGYGEASEFELSGIDEDIRAPSPPFNAVEVDEVIDGWGTGLKGASPGSSHGSLYGELADSMAEPLQLEPETKISSAPAPYGQDWWNGLYAGSLDGAKCFYPAPLFPKSAERWTSLPAELQCSSGTTEQPGTFDKELVRFITEGGDVPVQQVCRGSRCESTSGRDDANTASAKSARMRRQTIGEGDGMASKLRKCQREAYFSTIPERQLSFNCTKKAVRFQ